MGTHAWSCDRASIAPGATPGWTPGPLDPGARDRYTAAVTAPTSDSAERSSLRELIPSFPNTLLRCHSTVRGLRNSCADLRVGQPLACQLRDLPLLRGEIVACLDVPFAHRLPRRQELTPGTLGEPRHADGAQHPVGGAQLHTRVQRWFSRRSHSPCSRYARASSGRSRVRPSRIDRFAIQAVGGRPVAQQRLAAVLDSEREVVGGRLRRFREPLERVACACGALCASGGLDKLGKRERGYPALEGVRGGMPR